MSVANGSHRAALLKVLLLIFLGAQNLTRSQLSPAPVQEKMCTTFSCQGGDCFKGQEAVAVCSEGLDFCEVGSKCSKDWGAVLSQSCKPGGGSSAVTP